MAGLFDDLDTNPMESGNTNVTTAEDIRKEAHIANGGEASFQCPACNGRGVFYSYTGRAVGNCFKCKGAGKVSKRVIAAAKAKVTREANLANKINEFVEANGEVYAFIVKNREWSDFYRSMFDAIQTYGHLTDGQIAAVNRGIEKAAVRAEEKKAEREKLGGEVDISAIDRLFQGARDNGLKRLAFRAEGMKISAAKENSSNPGALYVEHEGVYAGKIVNGKFVPAYQAKQTTLARIVEIAADPLGQARLFGKNTGVCSCCGSELTNETSIANGIGPICESKWGF